MRFTTGYEPLPQIQLLLGSALRVDAPRVWGYAHMGIGGEAVHTCPIGPHSRDIAIVRFRV